MTGWRIGFGLVPPAIVGAMTKLQSHSTSNPSSISQKAAVEALRGPQESVGIMLADLHYDHLCVGRDAHDLALYPSIPVVGNQNAIDYEAVMEIAVPYLGEMAGVYDDWTPLRGRSALFREDTDPDDPWQFKNFRVT